MPESADDSAVPTATGRRIAGLALPALGVLAAEPLYLLFDIAIVTPVFRDGKVVGLMGTVGHVSDIGGTKDSLRAELRATGPTPMP